MKFYPVEIVFQGHSFRTEVEANNPHSAIDYVLENVNVYVECEDEEWEQTSSEFNEDGF